MKQHKGLTPEERARIAEIQDMLINRYVEQRRHSIRERQGARSILNMKLKSSGVKRRRSRSGRLSDLPGAKKQGRCSSKAEGLTPRGYIRVTAHPLSRWNEDGVVRPARASRRVTKMKIKVR